MAVATVLVARRRSLLAPLITCCVFLAISIARLRGSEWAWLPILFFGAGALLIAIQLLPGASWLRVSEQGLEVCSLFRVRIYVWNEVGDFRVRWVPFQRVVAFTFNTRSQSEGFEGTLRFARGRHRWLQDSYGVPPRALAEFLNERRHECTA